MIIIENNTAKLNDIVFANRNKSYGAYAIRSTYDNTIIKSLVITGLIFVSLSALAMAFSNTAPSEVKIDIGTNIPDIIYKNIDVNITPKVISCGALPAVKSIQAVSIPTEIKDVTTEQKKEIIQTVESTTGTESAKGSTDPSTGSGVEGIETKGTGNDPISDKSAEPVMAPDIMPSFNIGPFLQRNLKYPAMALEANVSGKVVVNFIVDEEGNILKSTILKGVGYGCDEEALRVIKLMPKWTPGRSNGKPVKVSFNQVIIFRLQ